MESVVDNQAPPAWASQLFQMVQTQMERTQTLEQQLAEYRNGGVNATPESLSQGTSTAAMDENVQHQGAVHQKAKLPELPEFNGKRSEFRPWLTQVRAKLAIDKATETELVRFWYVHSRLRGDALVQVSSWVTSVEGTDAMVTDGLLGQLRAAYDDTESSERAARKLNQIRQGSRPFNTFIAEFDRTIIDAGGLTWLDQVKKTFLSNSLSDELQAAIVASPTPTTYKGYCSLLQSVSTNLEALWKKKQANKSYRTTVPEVETVPADDMDWSPTDPTTVVTSAVRAQRAQWVPPEVLEKRKADRRCLRCGKEGHFVRDCPLLPAIRERSRQVKRPVTHTAASETTLSASEKLGKE